MKMQKLLWSLPLLALISCGKGEVIDVSSEEHVNSIYMAGQNLKNQRIDPENSASPTYEQIATSGNPNLIMQNFGQGVPLSSIVSVVSSAPPVSSVQIISSALLPSSSSNPLVISSAFVSSSIFIGSSITMPSSAISSSSLRSSSSIFIPPQSSVAISSAVSSSRPLISSSISSSSTGTGPQAISIPPQTNIAPGNSYTVTTSTCTSMLQLWGSREINVTINGVDTTGQDYLGIPLPGPSFTIVVTQGTSINCY